MAMVTPEERDEYLWNRREEIIDYEHYVNEIDGVNCAWDHNYVIRYEYNQANTIVLKKQCTWCGRLRDNKLIKHDTIPNLKEKIALNEVDKINMALLITHAATYENYAEFRDKKYKHSLQETKNEWHIKHKNHLNSLKWKQIRLKVLVRDNYFCQACLDAEAVHVHHKTYDNLGDEFMYELMSVCIKCHNRIHNR